MKLHKFLYSKYIFSPKKDAAPGNGAASFFCSTKTECFHLKQFSKGFAFCERTILLGLPYWQSRTMHSRYMH